MIAKFLFGCRPCLWRWWSTLSHYLEKLDTRPDLSAFLFKSNLDLGLLYPFELDTRAVDIASSSADQLGSRLLFGLRHALL